MTSIRRTLLVWLLLGLAAVAVLASVATYFDTKREIGELFDLQLKQLAYSTRIDDLLRGRQPSVSGPGADRTAGVSEIVTQIWDRDGVLVYYSRPGTGLPVPATEGYSNVMQNGHAWRVYTHVEGRHALQVAHALDELSARMRALLRRDIAREDNVLRNAELALDPGSRTVTHRGVAVDVSAREFALLAALLERPGTALSKTQLEERLYGWGEEVESNTVEVHVHNLRKKLGAEAIRTIRGVGYLVAKA